MSWPAASTGISSSRLLRGAARGLRLGPRGLRLRLRGALPVLRPATLLRHRDALPCCLTQFALARRGGLARGCGDRRAPALQLRPEILDTTFDALFLDLKSDQSHLQHAYVFVASASCHVIPLPQTISCGVLHR